MYSSCALAQRLAGGARQLDDAEADEHFGGLGAHDARLIDQPRQHRRQRALAIADRAERLDRRRAHRPASGSAAAPINALTIAGVTSRRLRRSTAFYGRSRSSVGRRTFAELVAVERRLCLRRSAALSRRRIAIPTPVVRCIQRRWRGPASPAIDRPPASPAPAASSHRPSRRDTSCRPATRPWRGARRRPTTASICFAAHSGERSSWHVVHAFGTPNCAVFSGTGGWNV